MEKQEIDKEDLKELKKELKKIGYNYDILSEKCQNYLVLVFIFYKKQIDEFNQNWSKLLKTELSVIQYCDFCNITKQALYKKNRGVKIYDCVIKYLLKKQNNFNSYKKEKINNNFRINNIDYKLMDQLLQKELEYMRIHNELNEANEKISSLERQLKNQNHEKFKENYSKLN